MMTDDDVVGSGGQGESEHRGKRQRASDAERAACRRLPRKETSHRPTAQTTRVSAMTSS